MRRSSFFQAASSFGSTFVTTFLRRRFLRQLPPMRTCLRHGGYARTSAPHPTTGNVADEPATLPIRVHSSARRTLSTAARWRATFASEPSLITPRLPRAPRPLALAKPAPEGTSRAQPSRASRGETIARDAVPRRARRRARRRGAPNSPTHHNDVRRHMDLALVDVHHHRPRLAPGRRSRALLDARNDLLGPQRVHDVRRARDAHVDVGGRRLRLRLTGRRSPGSS